MELKSKNSLCIIIPVYNEEKGLSKCISLVMQEVKKIKFPIILLVVNDGSTDETAKILKREKKKYSKKLLIFSHSKNQGYGKALQTGIMHALGKKYTHALFMDSDLTNNPKYIRNFLPFIDKDIDCIKASRYVFGGKTIDVPFYRCFVSILGNSIAAELFDINVKDVTNGFRMVKLKDLKRMQYKENDFAIIMEEMYYLAKKHATFAEIPVTLTARKNSKSHFVYSFKTLWNYFKYPLKYFLEK